MPYSLETTESTSRLEWLHDRLPCILERHGMCHALLPGRYGPLRPHPEYCRANSYPLSPSRPGPGPHTVYLPSEEGSPQEVIRTFTSSPRPESGLDCLMCAIFAQHHRVEQQPLHCRLPWLLNLLKEDSPFCLTRAITRTMIGQCFTPLSLAPRDPLHP